MNDEKEEVIVENIDVPARGVGLKKQIEAALKKPEIYCGDSHTLPPDYDKFGSRFSCLKKGYGSALFNATDEDIRKAREKKANQPPHLTRQDISRIAMRLAVSLKKPDGSPRTRREILQGIIDKLKQLEDEIED